MSVVDTTRQLLWALILLGLVQYSFGVTTAMLGLPSMFRHWIIMMCHGWWYIMSTPSNCVVLGLWSRNCSRKMLFEQKCVWARCKTIFFFASWMVQGILFTDAVLDYAASNGPDEAQMRYFGTVYTSFGWNQQAFVPVRSPKGWPWLSR